MSDNPTTSEKDTFAQRMVNILNHGALNLAIAIGYRTGLFDVLDSFDTPQSLDTIAQEANLNSRYIHEWLGIMCTGKIVEISNIPGQESLFFLPKAHADILTRRSGNANLAVYAQEMPLLTTCSMEAVIDSFQTGNGIGYENYPRFQAFMTELANAKHHNVLVQQFLPSVDGGRLVKKLRSGIRVCDLGCGEGVAVLLMAAAFPESTFVGIDIAADVIEIAEKARVKSQLANAEFITCDAAHIVHEPDLRANFDYITAFDAIHDQTAPQKALQGIKHMLASGGLFSMVDIAAESAPADNLDHPMGPFLYTVSLMHCMPVGLVDGGMGLGMMWGRQQAVQMLQRAGFSQVTVCEMDHDPFNLHYLCRA